MGGKQTALAKKHFANCTHGSLHIGIQNNNDDTMPIRMIALHARHRSLLPDESNPRYDAESAFIGPSVGIWTDPRLSALASISAMHNVIPLAISMCRNSLGPWAFE
uniref:Uncharacterized protein n=1 Tax=Candidatus Kentrum sp. LFY TaxID=2126342 RepID=A0A450U5T8_9GAMM|nr:MAG: hypothetical protein BECKLFY1418B_GA0070995_100376 [Candidatus Kentron sp. LFY]